MYKYIIWKFWTTLLTFFVSVVIFYFMYVIFKGNPFANNPQYADVDKYEAAIESYGINLPAYQRFLNYIHGIFHGDWGKIFIINSSQYHTIPSLMLAPLKKSMMVTVPSYFIGMFVGLGLGFWAGYKRGKTADIIINGFVTIFIAVPSFVFAIFMLIIAPIFGLSIQFADAGLPTYTHNQMILSLIAPIITLSLLSLAGWTYILRNEVASILSSEYILAARTKGLSPKTIFFRYVLRNSMYPYIGGIVTSFMVVFSSSIIIEKFFGVPGVGRTLVTASRVGEINILMFNIIFFSSISLFSQIIVDLAQFTINPLVRANFNSKTSFVTKFASLIARRKQRTKMIIGGN